MIMVTHMNEIFTDYITAEEYMEFRKAVGWAEFPLEEAEAGLNKLRNFGAVSGAVPQ